LSGGFPQFLWLELTNPSDWVFALASFIIILSGYAGISDSWQSVLSRRTTGLLRYGTACLLGITGFCLIIAGLDPVAGAFPALYPGPDKTLMAGLVALCGAIVLVLISELKRQVIR
jgi:hypothetical protein